MRRQASFTKVEVEEVRSFALSIGLGFARYGRWSDSRRRFLIHEAGHIIMYAGLGITGWRVRFDASGADVSIPAVEVSGTVAILMALGGPLAEEAHCGARGVFLGAVDDLWQVKEAGVLHDVPELKALVAQARQVLAARKRLVLAAADILGERHELSEDDIGEVEDLARKYGAAKKAG